MPIYEYRCQSCGHQVEVMQKMSDAPLEECPACHGHEMKKLISAGSHSFKEKEVGCGGGACGTGGCPALQ